MREVAEWIGATDSTPVPRAVRLRVFDRYQGRCYLSGLKIQVGDAWDVEHVIAIECGGSNRESNLAPALKAAHAVKTKADRRTGAKLTRVRMNHLGIKKPRKGRSLSHPTLRRKFDGSVVPK